MEREDLYLYEYNYGGTTMAGMRNNSVVGKWFEISCQWTKERCGEDIITTFTVKNRSSYRVFDSLNIFYIT
jgi:hypothetical protein